MVADSVVEHFDVFEEAPAGLGVGAVVLVVDEFFLQGGEERLHRREEEDYRSLSFILPAGRRTDLASQQLPLRLIEQVMSCFESSCW